MEPIIDGRNLRMVVIVCDFGNMGGFLRWWVMVMSFPHAQMLQYLFDELLVLDEGDDL